MMLWPLGLMLLCVNGAPNLLRQLRTQVFQFKARDLKDATHYAPTSALTARAASELFSMPPNEELVGTLPRGVVSKPTALAWVFAMSKKRKHSPPPPSGGGSEGESPPATPSAGASSSVPAELSFE